ncbi:Uncharacterised protein [Mycobacteroides abscessus subsp. abscessus]|nr:Uncharacterised protein [Mycobacteroides abscessus subsp. abscessus]
MIRDKSGIVAVANLSPEGIATVWRCLLGHAIRRYARRHHLIEQVFHDRVGLRHHADKPAVLRHQIGDDPCRGEGLARARRSMHCQVGRI